MSKNVALVFFPLSKSERCRKLLSKADLWMNLLCGNQAAWFIGDKNLQSLICVYIELYTRHSNILL